MIKHLFVGGLPTVRELPLVGGQEGQVIINVLSSHDHIEQLISEAKAVLDAVIINRPDELLKLSSDRLGSALKLSDVGF